MFFLPEQKAKSAFCLKDCNHYYLEICMAILFTSFALYEHTVRKTLLFKILLLTFKAIHNLTLSDLLHINTPIRTLRSSASLHLTVPPFRLTTMGSRAFSRSAPRL